MAKLKLTSIPDDKPIKLTIEVPAAVFRDRAAYAEAMGRVSGQATPEIAGESLSRWSTRSNCSICAM
jgi:hypothetical protein